MTLTSPYASTAAPDAEWYSAMDAFLDSCVAAGFRVNFQLIAFESKPNDAGTLANLTAQINRYKSHPAIMAWYLVAPASHPPLCYPSTRQFARQMRAASQYRWCSAQRRQPLTWRCWT
jgi:hypothetical protein